MSDEEVFIKPKKRGATLRKKEQEKLSEDNNENNKNEDETVIIKQKKAPKGITVTTTKKFKEECEVAEETKPINPITFSSTGEETTMNRQKELATRQTIIDGPVPDGPKNNFLPQSEPKIKGSGIRAGPIAQTLYARVTTRFDYQQDICKDYKETGTCSFGDTCKFLHDRGDYKTGWELEKEFEAELKRKQEALLSQMNEDNSHDNNNDQENQTKSGCPICEKPFKNPVKVKGCGHFFCETCVVGPMAKSLKGKCYVCGEKMGTSFKSATQQEKLELLIEE